MLPIRRETSWGVSGSGDWLAAGWYTGGAAGVAGTTGWSAGAVEVSAGAEGAAEGSLSR